MSPPPPPTPLPRTREAAVRTANPAPLTSGFSQGQTTVSHHGVTYAQLDDDDWGFRARGLQWSFCAHNYVRSAREIDKLAGTTELTDWLRVCSKDLFPHKKKYHT